MTEFHLTWTLVLMLAVFAAVMGTVAYLTFGERKVSAWVQDRIGPNRVGPWGLLQPVADGLKFFLKEDIVPSHVDQCFTSSPRASASPRPCSRSASSRSARPPRRRAPVAGHRPTRPLEAAAPNTTRHMDEYHSAHGPFAVAPGLDIGILFVFAIGSLAVYGIILGGWSSNNKYSLLGGLRSSAQIISYEIPLGMSILGVVLIAGSLNLEADHQLAGRTRLGHPVQPLAFLLFLVIAFRRVQPPAVRPARGGAGAGRRLPHRVRRR